MVAQADYETKTGGTTGKVADAAHETIDQLAARAALAEERIRKVAAEAEDRLRNSARRAEQKSGDITQSITDYVHERPVTALGIAFFAGLIFSSFLRR